MYTLFNLLHARNASFGIISTESPIQQNYHINNYNSEKEQIFQVKSMPKKRQENNIKQLINQKREREKGKTRNPLLCKM